MFAKNEKINKEHLPVHVAAIMDGNGRWAQSRGLPRKAGHAAGAETFRKVAEYLNELGIRYFTVYAFSTENWKRPADEVEAIMGLLVKYLHESIDTMIEKNIRLRFLGDLSPLSEELKALIRKTDELSAHTNGLCVSVCLNYGGRAEITRAAQLLAQRCVSGGLSPEEITPDMISGSLYSDGMPDPDLVIRTGHEKRISNFLLWQSAYAEYYFSEKPWPEFTPNEMAKAILEYQNRTRRFGGL